MIFLALALVPIAVYLVFVSSDLLDFTTGIWRLLLTVLLLLGVCFEDSGVLETSVLFYALFILVLLGINRKEVQVNHDGV